MLRPKCPECFAPNFPMARWESVIAVVAAVPFMAVAAVPFVVVGATPFVPSSFGVAAPFVALASAFPLLVPPSELYVAD